MQVVPHSRRPASHNPFPDEAEAPELLVRLEPGEELERVPDEETVECELPT
jgi:hypothetical protein